MRNKEGCTFLWNTARILKKFIRWNVKHLIRLPKSIEGDGVFIIEIVKRELH